VLQKSWQVQIAKLQIIREHKPFKIILFGKLFYTSWLWGPPSLLSYGYRELLLWGYSGRGVKLTTYLHLVKVMAKFSLCLTKHHAMKAYWEMEV
jgi:hypothetical protein